MNQITTVGVDLAKQLIVVCAADASGRTIFFKQFGFQSCELGGESAAVHDGNGTDQSGARLAGSIRGLARTLTAESQAFTAEAFPGRTASRTRACAAR